MPVLGSYGAYAMDEELNTYNAANNCEMYITHTVPQPDKTYTIGTASFNEVLAPDYNLGCEMDSPVDLTFSLKAGGNDAIAVTSWLTAFSGLTLTIDVSNTGLAP